MRMATGRVFEFVQRSALIIALMASFAWSGQTGAFAGEAAGWAVTETNGGAMVRVGEGPWTDLSQGDILVPQSELKTTEGGRVVLAKGGDVITVSPNSRMAIPVPNDGTGASIFQSLGTLLFKMETRPERGFKVQTPVLAAAIKGTTFTVTVNNDGAGLHVVEGSVEVTALDTGQVALVYPGQTATVPAVAGASLSIIEGRRSEIRKQNQDASTDTVGADAAQPKSTNAQPRQSSGSNSVQIRGKQKINKTLGNSSRDISVLTDGLIANVRKGSGQPVNQRPGGAKGKSSSAPGVGGNGAAGPGVATGNGFGAGGLGAIHGNGVGAGGATNSGIGNGVGGANNASAVASQGQGQGQGNGQGKGKGKGKKK